VATTYGFDDEGYFGPRSIVWRVHGDPSGMIGGLRALLFQALDPPTMAGVAQHSDYRNDSWGRLVRTSHYIMATTYGDRKTADRAAAKVRGIHKHIRGIDPVTGRHYDATDPDLLLWVHAAEVDSFLEGYRAYGRGLSEEEADRYVAEMVTAAELIGIPPEMAPTTVAELKRYIEERDLLATPEARDAMRFVLLPPVPLPGGRIPDVPGGRLLVIPGRAVWTTLATATIAILPTRVRRMYRLPWVPLTPPLRASIFGLTRTIRRLFPPPPEVRWGIERMREGAA
jgi:uncharacterized protein (DUF2236 family)